MRLHHVVESARDHNWFVVGVELIIVIVGVFIGIQVANWNEDRLDQKRAHSYLVRISADLEADIDSYRDRLRFWQAVEEYGATAIDYADTGLLDDHSKWDVLLAYFQASQLAEFYTTDATYDEIKGAGELGLIADLELRNSLAYYYTNANNPALTERPAYREHVRGIIPLELQSYIWEHCYTANELGIQVLLDCEAPESNVNLEPIITNLGGDRQLSQELRYWMSTMHVASLIGNARIESAIQLRESIEEKVGI
jgi:hypothetical protein